MRRALQTRRRRIFEDLTARGDSTGESVPSLPKNHFLIALLHPLLSTDGVYFTCKSEGKRTRHLPYCLDVAVLPPKHNLLASYFISHPFEYLVLSLRPSHLTRIAIALGFFRYGREFKLRA